MCREARSSAARTSAEGSREGRVHRRDLPQPRCTGACTEGVGRTRDQMARAPSARRPEPFASSPWKRTTSRRRAHVGARMGHTGGRRTSNFRGAVVSKPVVGDTVTYMMPKGVVRVGRIVDVHGSVIAFDFNDGFGISTRVTYLRFEGIEWIRGAATPEQRDALRVAYALAMAA